MKFNKYLTLIIMGGFIFMTSCSNNPNVNVFEPETIDDSQHSNDPINPDDSSYEPWVPDIIDLDDPTIIDDVTIDDTVYDYSSVSFKKVRGTYEENEGTYVCTEIFEDKGAITKNNSSSSPFTHGTFSVDIKLNKTVPSDSGIIFGLNSNDIDVFWEDSNISYYFFFINKDGLPYLAKSVDKEWYEINVGQPVDITRDEAFNLKVLFYGNKILCLIDNELVFGCRDINYLSGSEYGFRCGTSGVEYSNIFLSSDRVI